MVVPFGRLFDFSQCFPFYFNRAQIEHFDPPHSRLFSPCGSVHLEMGGGFLPGFFFSSLIAHVKESFPQLMARHQTGDVFLSSPSEEGPDLPLPDLDKRKMRGSCWISSGVVMTVLSRILLPPPPAKPRSSQDPDDFPHGDAPLPVPSLSKNKLFLTMSGPRHERGNLAFSPPSLGTVPFRSLQDQLW